MNVLRQLIVRIVTPLLSMSIIASVSLLSLNLNFSQPDNLKQWLRQSRIFDSIVPTIVAQSKQTGPNEDPNLARPEVQAALEKAVTPEFLETSSNKIIDGTYNWLQGKTDKPNYDIDLSPVKAAFASSIGDQARNRLASLPACSLSQPPTSDDPFTTNCRPPAAATESQIQKMVDELTVSNDFLGQNHITADTKSLNNSVDQTTSAMPQIAWYQQLSKLPALYSWAQKGPWLLGLLAVLLAMIIVFASRTKRQGGHNVAWTVFSAGILLTLGAGLVMYLANKISFANMAETAALHQPLIDLIKLITRNVSQPLLVSGIVLLIGSVISLITLHRTKPKPTAQPPKAPQTFSTQLPAPPTDPA